MDKQRLTSGNEIRDFIYGNYPLAAQDFTKWYFDRLEKGDNLPFTRDVDFEELDLEDEEIGFPSPIEFEFDLLYGLIISYIEDKKLNIPAFIEVYNKTANFDGGIRSRIAQFIIDTFYILEYNIMAKHN